MVNIAIFASGHGTNAMNIIKYFTNNASGKVQLVISNKAEAPVLLSAKNAGVECYIIPDSDMRDKNLLPLLIDREIGFLVLAGFLKLIPQNIIEKFKNKIINIHPSLLPKFGGKGMYGMKVHVAVVASGVSETGITIHYINDVYDDGEIIFQAKAKILPGDNPADVMQKVIKLEHEHFPVEVEKLIMQ